MICYCKALVQNILMVQSGCVLIQTWTFRLLSPVNFIKTLTRPFMFNHIQHLSGITTRLWKLTELYRSETFRICFSRSSYTCRYCYCWVISVKTCKTVTFITQSLHLNHHRKDNKKTFLKIWLNIFIWYQQCYSNCCGVLVTSDPVQVLHCQSLHTEVRAKCVEFLKRNRETYEAVRPLTLTWCH